VTSEDRSAFLFDDVRVEPASFRVFKAGNAVQVEPKALKLLLYLIENRGRLIEREEILGEIWNGTHVTENALSREIAKLRRSLGDDSKTPRYIETVRTRGFRFIAEVLVEAVSSRAAGNGSEIESIVGISDCDIDLQANRSNGELSDLGCAHLRIVKVILPVPCAATSTRCSGCEILIASTTSGTETTSFLSTVAIKSGNAARVFVR